nr:MAG TPA: hypothetical protein [Microviridae sp.]
MVTASIGYALKREMATGSKTVCCASLCAIADNIRSPEGAHLIAS